MKDPYLHRPSSNDSETTKEHDGTSDGRATTTLDRRTALKTGVAAFGSAVGFSAVSGSAAAERGERKPNHHGIDFDRVLHAVDDLGMDPTGEEPIGDKIDWREGTLIEFPDGEFAYDGDWKSGLTRYGWTAEGPDSDPALVPAEDIHNTSTITFVYWDEGEDLLFEGIDFDFTEPEHGGWLSMKIASGVGYWENVTVNGPWPDDPDYSAFFSPYTTSESARLEVRNFTAMDGWEGYEKNQGEDANYHPIGVWVAYPHTGEVLFEDCAIGYFPDNGLYADGAGLDTDKGDAIDGGGGTVMVENCHFENNNISNIRIGTAGSYAKDCTIHVDEDCPTHANGSNARPVWLRYEGDMELENVRIEATGHRGSGGIVESRRTGPNTIKDCTLELSEDANYESAVLRNGSAAAEGSTYEGLRIESGLDDTELSEGAAAIVVEETEGTTITDSCIETTFPDKDGVSFVDSTAATVSDTNFAVTGDAIVTENASVSTSDITYRDSCPRRYGSHGERGEGHGKGHDGDR